MRARLVISTLCSAALVCTVAYLVAGWSKSDSNIPKHLEVEPERVVPTIDVTSPAGIYIPRDLTTAVRELRTMLPSDVLGRISLSEPRDAHTLNYSSGQWLVSLWNLAGRSPLAEYFRSEGIRHPKDMTAVVFDALIRDVSGKPWSISQQLDCGRFLTEQREDTTERTRYVFSCRF